MTEIRIPIADIDHVALVARKVRANDPAAADENFPLYAVIRDGEIELRQGNCITYGVRRFTPLDDAGRP